MITLHPANRSTPLRRPWKNGIAVGRAYDLLRSDLLEHLAWVQREIGFRSCRFHAIFHDDMAVVRRRKDGSLVCQWHHVDKVYDALLRLGLRPFVELNPMPSALASGTQTMFHYKMNVTPPRKWEEWEWLIRQFVSHCVERYGLSEVRQWHFEVWNEPNLSAFWSGTKEEYFLLYRYAAQAVKSVDPELKVGGPASSKAYWLEDLIGYCDREKVPLDFISTHLYPQDEFVEFKDRASSPYTPGEFFAAVVRKARRTVEASPLPHLPIHWTEWNTQLATSSQDVSWGENLYVDSLHGASFVVRNMVELDSDADTLTFWVVSDIFEEGPIPNTPFSRTYGLVTVHGIPKATCNAFRLLERMRGPRIGFEPSLPPPPYCGGIATQEGEAIHVLLWNDVPPECRNAMPWQDAIQLSASKPLVVTRSWIKAGAGSPYEAWEGLGKPVNLSPIQLAWLRQAAEPAMHAELLKPSEGRVVFPFALGPNEVMHMEFRPQEREAVPTSQLLTPEQCAKLEAQLGEKSR